MRRPTEQLPFYYTIRFITRACTITAPNCYRNFFTPHRKSHIISKTAMSADADTTMHESRLLRASHSRNRRRYSQIAPVVSLLWLFCSYRLARPMSVCFAMQACRSTQPLSGTFIVNKYRKPGQASPAPMLLFPFLLFQFKLPLFLCFPLFPAHSFTFSFQLLLL